MQEKHIQEAIKRSLNAQPNPADYAIPTPTFKVVAETDQPNFEQTVSYISYHSTSSLRAIVVSVLPSHVTPAVPTQKEMDSRVEYDLSDNDCEWLDEYNKVPSPSFCQQLRDSLLFLFPVFVQGNRRLSEDGLEFMIDRLEKAFCYNVRLPLRNCELRERHAHHLLGGSCRTRNYPWRKQKKLSRMMTHARYPSLI